MNINRNLVFALGISTLVLCSCVKDTGNTKLGPSQNQAAAQGSGSATVNINSDNGKMVQTTAKVDPVSVEATVKPVELRGPDSIQVQVETKQPIQTTAKIEPMELRLPEALKLEMTAPNKIELRPISITGEIKPLQVRFENPELTVLMKLETGTLPKELLDAAARYAASPQPPGDGSEPVPKPAKDTNGKGPSKGEAPPPPEPSKGQFWMLFFVILIAGLLGGLVRHSFDRSQLMFELEELKFREQKLKDDLKPLESERHSLFLETRKKGREIDGLRPFSIFPEEEEIKDPKLSAKIKALEAEEKSLSTRLTAIEAEIKKIETELALARVRITAIGNMLRFQPLTAGVIAAYMVPGICMLIPGNLLKTAANDGFHLLGFGSLCLIVAAIGQPFIQFVFGQAHALMDKWYRKTVAEALNNPK